MLSGSLRNVKRISVAAFAASAVRVQLDSESLAWGMGLHHSFSDGELSLTNNYCAQMSIRSAQATPQQHW